MIGSYHIVDVALFIGDAGKVQGATPNPVDHKLELMCFIGIQSYGQAINGLVTGITEHRMGLRPIIKGPGQDHPIPAVLPNKFMGNWATRTLRPTDDFLLANLSSLSTLTTPQFVQDRAKWHSQSWRWAEGGG